MGRLKQFVNNELWLTMFLLGLIAGVLVMVWIVPRTKFINTIPYEQNCVDVTALNQTQSFCKEVSHD
jgi:hypothetical protein